MIKDVFFNLNIDCKVTNLFIENEDLIETEFIYMIGSSAVDFAIP
jgi:hypothetical protein